MDFFDLCSGIHDQSIDLILSDMPYQVLDTGWDFIIPIDRMWKEYKRIIKPQGAIVLTAKPPFSSMLVMGNMDQYRYSWYLEKPRGAYVALSG